MFFPKLTKNRILLILILSLSVILSLPYLWANHLYNAAVKEAEAKGFVLEFSKLASPEIPDSQNASALLEEAAKYFENYSGIQYRVIDDMLDLANEGFSRRMTREEFEGLKADIEFYNEAIRLAEQAAQREHARFKTDYDTPVPFSIQVPNFMSRQRLVRLLQAKALILILEGQRGEAYLCVQEMFRLSRLCGEESPFLIGTIIGFNLIDYSCQALQGLERISPPNAEERAAITKEIEAIPLHSWMKKSLLMECASFRLSLDAFLTGETMPLETPYGELLAFFLRYPGRFLVRSGQASNLRANMYYYDLLSSPYYLLKDKNAEEPHSSNFSIFAIKPPNYINFIKRKDKQQVNLDFAKISFALQEWKEKKNAYPADLPSLKEILGVIPSDPFSGREYQYKPKNGGYILYSLGWNLKDDGGVSAQSGEDENNQGDIVWSLP